MRRRNISLVFLFFMLTFTLTNAFRESVQIPDEEYVLLVTSNLVEGRPLHLPDGVPLYPGASYKGADGKPYSIYQIGQSLVYAPFYWVTKTILSFSDPYHPKIHGESRSQYDIGLERETRRYLAFCPTIFAALGCALFFVFALYLGYTENIAVLLTLAYGLGTMVWPYSKYLLTESMQNTLLLIAVYLLFRQRQKGRIHARKMILAGLAFGLLVSIRVNLLVLLPLLGFYWFWRNEDRRLLAPTLLFLLPVLVIYTPQFIYDHIRFQNILSVGYSTSGFKTPLWVGLYGYLFSSGKSFFLYAPITLLVFFGFKEFFRRARSEAILFLLLFVAVPLQYAAWWVWSGDPSWGPRYLLILTPYLLLPVGEVLHRVLEEKALWRRGVVFALFGLSAWIQVLAISVHYLYYHNYLRSYGSLIPRTYISQTPHTASGSIPIRDRFIESEFNPEYSPILGQWWMVKSLLLKTKNPGETAPWAGLGYADLHAKAPLKAKWDFWLVNLFESEFDWKDIGGWLGALALILFYAFVAEEFLRILFVRPK